MGADWGTFRLEVGVGVGEWRGLGLESGMINMGDAPAVLVLVGRLTTVAPGSEGRVAVGGGPDVFVGGGGWGVFVGAGVGAEVGAEVGVEGFLAG